MIVRYADVCQFSRPNRELTSTQSVNGNKVGVHDVGRARGLGIIEDEMSAPPFISQGIHILVNGRELTLYH